MSDISLFVFPSRARGDKTRSTRRRRRKKRTTYPLLHRLVLAEHLGLPEHRVDERGLAVVDVRDDGDVADVLAELGREVLGGLGGRGGRRRGVGDGADRDKAAGRG